MTDKIQQVYVIQGRGQRDYADCEAVLAGLPARMTVLPFLATEDEVIARARDADALEKMEKMGTNSLYDGSQSGVRPTGLTI